jgi:hypothetical protein
MFRECAYGLLGQGRSAGQSEWTATAKAGALSGAFDAWGVEALWPEVQHLASVAQPVRPG